jgi:hypothetical protein
VDIVLKFDKSLKRDDQVKQLREVMKLILSGPARTKGIGFMDQEQYATAERVLFDTKQISNRVKPASVFDDTLWREVPESDKHPK